ncbi:MAG TPA: hypothetical protein VEZ40_03725 [Pyrinomonadaceae bacterium]|nr:hypothetical protein [Pyrinomonadaceae bacterium]
MTVNLELKLSSLGSVQRLVGILLEDLLQGRSLLMQLPAGVSCAEVWMSVSRQLRWRDCEVRVIHADDVPRGHSLASAIGEQLRVQWPSAETQRTLDNLLKCDGMPEVVYCEGLDRLLEDQVGGWLELLSRWAEFAQNMERPPALCIIAPAPVVLGYTPNTNVRLAVRKWWGIPSLLELRLLCRDEQEEAGASDGEDAWREHILPALSGGDVSLASDLWGVACSDEDKIREALGEHARRRGWSRQRLSDWGAEEFLRGMFMKHGTTSSRLPAAFEKLWAEGAIGHTREHGLELHTGALETLGQHEAVRHRLWRGQAALLLPIIDGVRLRLCQRLTDVYGRGWSHRWIQPSKEREYAAVTESDLGCELGHLAYLLRSCREIRAYDGWIPLTTRARDMRNELAHYRPVSFMSFNEFWQDLHRVEGSLPEAF